MVWIEGRAFPDGSDAHYYGGASPSGRGRRVLDRPDPGHQPALPAVVEATGHVTIAEEPASIRPSIPGPIALSAAGLRWFTPPPLPVTSFANPLVWWQLVHGADWRHPTGPAARSRGSETSGGACGFHARALLPRPARRCRPRRSGLFAAGGARWSRIRLGDELTFGGRHMANTGRGVSEPEQPGGSLAAHVAGRGLPAERLWRARHDRQMSGNGRSTGIWRAEADALASPLLRAAAIPRRLGVEGSYDPATPDYPIPRKVLKGARISARRIIASATSRPR